MSTDSGPAGAPSYRALAAVPGLARLGIGALAARTAASMLQVALVLLMLQRFKSPTLAGLTAFVFMGLGLSLSPLAGALLDRRGRIRLIAFDYAVAAAGFGLLAALSWKDLIGSGLTVLIVAASSVTTPLSTVGTRTLVPLVVPRHLWDRANAADSAGYVVATLFGPALAGLVAGSHRAPVAVGVAAGLFAAGAVIVAGASEPEGSGRGGRLLAEAREGIRYVVHDPALRGLGMTLSVYNLSYGAVTVALPVIVLRDLRGGSSAVGLLFSVMGLCGIASAVLTGRVASEGRERAFLVLGIAASVPGLALIAAAPSVVVAGIGLAIVGVANGPIDIGLFGLRQRRTDPSRLGTAFAVSMAFNFAGVPAGSALAGVVAAHSARLAIGSAIAVCVAAIWLAATTLPSGRAG
jgi:MFS family permease